MQSKRVIRWFTSELYDACHPIEMDDWMVPFMRRAMSPGDWDKIRLEYGRDNEELLRDLRLRLTDQRLRDSTAEEIEQWFCGCLEKHRPPKKKYSDYAKSGQVVGEEEPDPTGKPPENVEQDPMAKRTGR